MQVFFFFFETHLLHVSRSDVHLWGETRSPLERGYMHTDHSGERDCPPAPPAPPALWHEPRGEQTEHDWSFVVWFGLVHRTSFGCQTWSCVETNRVYIYFNIPDGQKRKKKNLSKTVKGFHGGKKWQELRLIWGFSYFVRDYTFCTCGVTVF